jgi:hypothetical protein
VRGIKITKQSAAPRGGFTPTLSRIVRRQAVLLPVARSERGSPRVKSGMLGRSRPQLIHTSRGRVLCAGNEFARAGPSWLKHLSDLEAE